MPAIDDVLRMLASAHPQVKFIKATDLSIRGGGIVITEPEYLGRTLLAIVQLANSRLKAVEDAAREKASAPETPPAG